MAAAQIDRLLDEVDRQISGVRDQAGSIANRSILLLSLTGVAATVLASRIQREAADFSNALWPLGVALFAGLLSIIPNLLDGPTNAAITRWQGMTANAMPNEMLMTKLTLLEVNKKRLAVVTWSFYVALGASTVAIAMALIVAGGQVSGS